MAYLGKRRVAADGARPESDASEDEDHRRIALARRSWQATPPRADRVPRLAGALGVGLCEGVTGAPRRGFHTHSFAYPLELVQLFASATWASAARRRTVSTSRTTYTPACCVRLWTQRPLCMTAARARHWRRQLLLPALPQPQPDSPGPDVGPEPQLQPQPGTGGGS